MSNFLNWLVVEVFGSMDPKIILGFIVVSIIGIVWVLLWIVQNISRQFTHKKIVELNGWRQEDEQEYPRAAPFLNIHGLDESRMISNDTDPNYDYAKRQL